MSTNNFSAFSSQLPSSHIFLLPLVWRSPQLCQLPGHSQTMSRTPSRTHLIYQILKPQLRYDHAWSIANFTRKTDMENGEELKSGVFSIRTKDRQTDWFMRINPNGEEKTCKGFVSLFLYKDGNCEVEALLIFNFYFSSNPCSGSHQCRHHLQYCGQRRSEDSGQTMRIHFWEELAQW